MLKIEFTNQFKKDYKIAVIRGCDISELEKIITLLQMQEKLPEKYKDHKLNDSKMYKNCRECHIQPN